MGVLEDKISPFSNLKTGTTVILMVTLTIQVQQLFTAVVLASAATDFLYLGVHNCFAVGSTV